MVTKEDIINFGPKYLDILDISGRTPSFDYTYFSSTYNAPEGVYLLNEKYVVNSIDFESEMIELIKVKSYSIKKLTGNVTIKEDRINEDTMCVSFKDLVEKYYDRLYPKSYSNSDLEYYKSYWDYRFSTFFENVPAISNTAYIGDKKFRGKVSAYSYLDGDVEVSIYNDMLKKTKSIVLDYNLIEKIELLFELDNMLESLNIDLATAVQFWKSHQNLKGE